MKITVFQNGLESDAESTLEQNTFPKRVKALDYLYELHEDGTIMFSGNNFLGGRGFGNNASFKGSRVLPKFCDEKVIEIHEVILTTIFVTESSVYACGSNSHGALGVNSNDITVDPPERIQYPEHEIPVAMRIHEHSVFTLMESGKLYVHGWNTGNTINQKPTSRISRLGLGKESLSRRAIYMPTLMPMPDGEKVIAIPVIHITPMGTLFCHIQTENGFYVYGDNTDGALGLGHKDPIYSPQKIKLPDNEEVASIFHSYKGDTYVYTKNQRIYVCGKNYSSELLHISKYEWNMPLLPFMPMIGRDLKDELVGYGLALPNNPTQNKLSHGNPRYWLTLMKLPLLPDEKISTVSHTPEATVLVGSSATYRCKLNYQYRLFDDQKLGLKLQRPKETTESNSVPLGIELSFEQRCKL